ncbi:MAG: EAL domain-containing protein [Aquificaceae bacterium]|nr:EAL domain-containing protein [Aquificaceae bacterium]
MDRGLSIVGYECLIRGLNEDGRILPPSYMFKCAENTDTVFYLDRLCREMAIKSSSEKGLNDRLIFINFVPTSIYNPEMCLHSTIEMVNAYGLNPENIVFEVVESHKVDDLKHLIRILDYQREKGFKVALDDVGAGFSGLVNLVNLRPDIIKIDKEIVRGINGDNLKQGIVRALTDMCNKNGIRTIAEGIETYGELEFLIDKVDYLQGFLFAQPSEEPPKRLRGLR